MRGFDVAVIPRTLLSPAFVFFGSFAFISCPLSPRHRYNGSDGHADKIGSKSPIGGDHGAKAVYWRRFDSKGSRESVQRSKQIVFCLSSDIWTTRVLIVNSDPRTVRRTVDSVAVAD